MITFLLILADLANWLSVPWWLYLLAVVGAPVEVVILYAIAENGGLD